MPDGRQIVVDVKTPLDAYLTAAEASTDEDARRRAAAPRRGRAGARAPAVAEGLLVAVRAEPGFRGAVHPGRPVPERRRGRGAELLEDAIRQHVIIATPTSFIALLKAVAYGWRQNALAENALRIQELGEEMYKRLATFTTHIAKVGRTLGQSVEAYNAAVGSLERQVLPGARKFTELGLRPAKEIEELTPIDKLARGGRRRRAGGRRRIQPGPCVIADDPLQRGTPAGLAALFRRAVCAARRAAAAARALRVRGRGARHRSRLEPRSCPHAPAVVAHGDRPPAGRPARAPGDAGAAAAACGRQRRPAAAARGPGRRRRRPGAPHARARRRRSMRSRSAPPARSRRWPRRPPACRVRPRRAEREFARELGVAPRPRRVAARPARRHRRGPVAPAARDARSARASNPARPAAGTVAAGLPPTPRARKVARCTPCWPHCPTGSAAPSAPRNGRAWCWPHCTASCSSRIDHGRELARTRAELAPWPRFWTAWRTAVRHA